MMNKMNNKETRMATMKNAGMDVTKFFNLSMNIPVGSNVEIKIDGIPYTFNSSEDEIVKDIMEHGYIHNTKLDGRFVCAQTFKMLNEKSYNIKTNQWETGFDAYLRNRYPYHYQFDFMVDELKRLSKMEQSKDSDFEKMSKFFTKQVVIDTCQHYMRQLKKYINNAPTKKCKGKPYVTLNRYYMVLLTDVSVTVFKPLEKALSELKYSRNYKQLRENLIAFMDVMVKLPYETPKCSAFKDAYKGRGGYMSLNNIIKFGGVKVQNYETGEILDREASLAYIDSLLEIYKNDYWKYHELLKAVIELNNFDLRKSIESQK